jgi:hypothetical protein
MKPELEMPAADGTCEKTKRDGQRCRAMAIAGSQYCFFHDPATAKARRREPWLAVAAAFAIGYFAAAAIRRVS